MNIEAKYNINQSIFFFKEDSCNDANIEIHRGYVRAISINVFEDSSCLIKYNIYDYYSSCRREIEEDNLFGSERDLISMLKTNVNLFLKNQEYNEDEEVVDEASDDEEIEEDDLPF